MKSRLSKVLDKMPKENIELEKVELASIAELNKFVSSLETALKQLESNRSKLSSNLKDIEKVENDLKKNYNTALKNKNAIDTATKNAEKLADQIANQAKELGINPRSIDNVNELISLIEQIEGTQETIDSFINMSKKYI